MSGSERGSGKRGREIWMKYVKILGNRINVAGLACYGPEDDDYEPAIRVLALGQVKAFALRFPNVEDRDLALKKMDEAVVEGGFFR